MKQIISAIVMGAALVGCSGGSDSKGGGPVNNVKTKVSAGATKSLSGQAAILEAGNQYRGGRANAITETISAQAGPRSVTQRKAQKVSSILGGSGGCQVEFDADQTIGGGNPSLMAFRPMTLKTKAGCPIEMSMVMKLTETFSQGCQNPSSGENCKFKGSVVMKYNVKDEKLAAELEVLRGEIAMSFDIDQNMFGAGAGNGDADGGMGGGMNGMKIAIKSGMSFEMSTTDLQSLMYIMKGSQSLNMKMEMGPSAPGQMPSQSAVGAFKEEFHFLSEATNERADLSAALVANGSSGTATYLVDGATVTEEVYFAERQKMEAAMLLLNPDEKNQGGSTPPGPGNPSNPPGGPGNPPGPGNPSNPPTRPTPPENPPTAPGENQFFCVIQNYSTRDVYMGYGRTELEAKTKSTQNCQSKIGPSSCYETPTCERQTPVISWYCTTKNYQNSAIFSGEGKSKLEASVVAQKACHDVSGASGNCQAFRDATCEQL